MERLGRAYSTASDDDGERETPALPPSKRPKTEVVRRFTKPFPAIRPYTAQNLPPEPPIPGRYISKRERAALALDPPAPHSNTPSPTTQSPDTYRNSIREAKYSICLGKRAILLVFDTSSFQFKEAFLTHMCKSKGHAQFGEMSGRLSTALNGHLKAVNAVQWSKTHLLASAGMDHTVCIWNVWSNNQKKARVLNHHNAAVKDVKWSEQGLSVLSCGYDCSSRLVDVEKGLETQVFKEDQVVGVVKFHPNNSNLFLSGGSKGLIRLWDIRTGKVVHQYNRGLGPVLDVEFTNDTKQFISSSDVSRSNISENSLIVWDVSRQVPLSNQLLSEVSGLIFVRDEGDGFLKASLRERSVALPLTCNEVYVEAYTCPCIRCHPFDPYFVSQSHGNYIAIFSVKPPFRLDKYKRYDNHAVSGFPIKCNFNSDGEKLASGSSDGCIYLYNSKSCELIKKFKVFEQACIDVAFHPVMPNVIASCSWSGDVSVYE
ncbi:hypothetical protein RJ639_028189 [Escallonia herrerae]|uniref:WD repeat-containing protein 25 n=1 Tax=Escallonia herrerae TaxID=1293975 RepID=A0AA89BE70_9ASTE|nr:hypothetical protein RJ639_028189 [Escallonia herrerae]